MAINPRQPKSGHSNGHETGPRRALTQLHLADLQVFSKVMELRKGGLAAEALGLSGSAVSRSLSRLEAAIGKALFRRTSNRLLPLPEAHSVNRHVEAVLANITLIESSEPNSKGHGRVRVRTDVAIGLAFLPPLLAAFRREFPNIVVSLTFAGDPLATIDRRDEADLTIGPAADAGGAVVETFRRSRLHVALPRGHRLGSTTTVRAQALAGERWIRVSGGLAEVPFPLNDGIVVADVPCPLLAVDLVRAGMGISFVDPFPVALRARDGLVFLPLEPATPIGTNFTFAPGQERNSPARLLADFIKRTQPTDRYSTGLA